MIHANLQLSRILWAWLLSRRRLTILSPDDSHPSSVRPLSHTTVRPYRVDPPVRGGDGHRTWFAIGATVSDMRSHCHQSWPAVCPATAERKEVGNSAGPCELVRFRLLHLSMPCWQHFRSCRTSTHIGGHAGKSPSLPANNMSGQPAVVHLIDFTAIAMCSITSYWSKRRGKMKRTHWPTCAE